MKTYKQFQKDLPENMLWENSLLNWFNKGKNTRIPNEAQAPFGWPLEYFKKNPNPKTLFGDDALQRGMSNQAYKAGKKPGLFGRPDRAFGVDIPQSIRQRRIVGVPASEGGPGSGPTPIQREIIKRPIRAVKSGIRRLRGGGGLFGGVETIPTSSSPNSLSGILQKSRSKISPGDMMDRGGV